MNNLPCFVFSYYIRLTLPGYRLLFLDMAIQNDNRAWKWLYAFGYTQTLHKHEVSIFINK